MPNDTRLRDLLSAFGSMISGSFSQKKKNPMEMVITQEGSPGAPYINPDPGGMNRQLGWRSPDWMGGSPNPNTRQDQPGFAIHPGAAWDRSVSGNMNADDLTTQLAMVQKAQEERKYMERLRKPLPKRSRTGPLPEGPSDREMQELWKRLGIEMPVGNGK